MLEITGILIMELNQQEEFTFGFQMTGINNIQLVESNIDYHII